MDTDEQANLRHKDAGKSTYTVKKTNKKRDIKIVFVKLEGKKFKNLTEFLLLPYCKNYLFRSSHSKKLYEVFQF